jgi:hypothetical protein
LEELGLIHLGLEAGTAPQDARSDIVLSLKIDRVAAQREDVQELIRMLSLDPADLTYRLAAAVSGGGGKNIAVKPRSVLAAMRYLSKGVDVPDVDVRGGLVPVLRESGGSAFDWAKLLNGIMRISSSESWPANAYVRVFHQGHWFYIDNADLSSKHDFALIETAFALQAGDLDFTDFAVSVLPFLHRVHQHRYRLHCKLSSIDGDVRETRAMRWIGRRLPSIDTPAFPRGRSAELAGLSLFRRLRRPCRLAAMNLFSASGASDSRPIVSPPDLLR